MIDRSSLRSAVRLRRVALTVIAVVVLFLPAKQADAAVWVRIQTDPIYPRAGVPVAVIVQLLDTQGTECLDDPDARVVPNRTAYNEIDGPGPRLDAMELHVYGPGATEPVSLSVTRRVDDSGLWEGPFVFSVPGQWSLLMAYPSWSGRAGEPGSPKRVTDTCTGAEQVITVLPRSDAGATPCASPSPSALRHPAT